MSAATSTLSETNIDAGFLPPETWPAFPPPAGKPGVVGVPAPRVFPLEDTLRTLGGSSPIETSEPAKPEQDDQARQSVTSPERRRTGKINVESPVRPLLTGNMRKLYERLTAIVVTDALASGISIKQIRLYVFRDPEENSRKIVYEITILGNPAQAFAYWDSIGLHIDKWRDGLPSHLREKLVTHWSIRVRWD